MRTLVNKRTVGTAMMAIVALGCGAEQSSLADDDLAGDGTTRVVRAYRTHEAECMQAPNPDATPQERREHFKRAEVCMASNVEALAGTVLDPAAREELSAGPRGFKEIGDAWFNTVCTLKQAFEGGYDEQGPTDLGDAVRYECAVEGWKALGEVMLRAARFAEAEPHVAPSPGPIGAACAEIVDDYALRRCVWQGLDQRYEPALVDKLKKSPVVPSWYLEGGVNLIGTMFVFNLCSGLAVSEGDGVASCKKDWLAHFEQMVRPLL